MIAFAILSVFIALVVLIGLKMANLPRQWESEDKAAENHNKVMVRSRWAVKANPTTEYRNEE